MTRKISSGAYIITLRYERSIQRVKSLDIQLRDRCWGFGVETLRVRKETDDVGIERY
jgi:hypothetical protein